MPHNIDVVMPQGRTPTGLGRKKVSKKSQTYFKSVSSVLQGSDGRPTPAGARPLEPRHPFQEPGRPESGFFHFETSAVDISFSSHL